jgi:hypothetical protein
MIMAGNQIFIDPQKQEAFLKIQERLSDATLPQKGYDPILKW